MLKVAGVRFFAALLLATCALGCGRTHTLQEGVYTFKLKQVLRDDCAMQGEPSVISEGRLTQFGDTVRLDYGLFGIALQGSYKSKVEQMVLDGSAANVITTVSGNECLVEFATLHLDGTSVDASNFSGTFTVKLDSRGSDTCRCEFWFAYDATYKNP